MRISKLRISVSIKVIDHWRQSGCVIETGKIYVESTILVLQNDFTAEQRDVDRDIGIRTVTLRCNSSSAFQNCVLILWFQTIHKLGVVFTFKYKVDPNKKYLVYNENC